MTFSAGDIEEAVYEGKVRYTRYESEAEGDEVWSELRYSSKDEAPFVVTLAGAEYPMKYVAGQGGNEGGGETLWLVFEVDGRLFKKSGYYMSYDGCTWDGDVVEVKPVEKVVTVYEA